MSRYCVLGKNNVCAKEENKSKKTATCKKKNIMKNTRTQTGKQGGINMYLKMQNRTYKKKC